MEMDLFVVHDCKACAKNSVRYAGNILLSSGSRRKWDTMEHHGISMIWLTRISVQAKNDNVLMSINIRIFYSGKHHQNISKYHSYITKTNRYYVYSIPSDGIYWEKATN